jgi:hypothetical protein
MPPEKSSCAVSTTAMQFSIQTEPDGDGTAAWSYGLLPARAPSAVGSLDRSGRPKLKRRRALLVVTLLLALVALGARRRLWAGENCAVTPDCG